MNIILRGKGCNKSAQSLSEALNIPAKRQPSPDDCVIVRWGSTRTANEGGVGTINTKTSIYAASQKIKALKTLGDAGIDVPTVWKDLDSGLILPCLSRKELHRQGRDIRMVETEAEAECDLREGRVLVELLNVKNEYRAHIINEEPVKLFRKVKRTLNADDLIRSGRCGWGFYNINISRNSWLQPLLEKAVKSAIVLGLYFTAIDIIHTLDHRFVVLEANSAPGISNNSIVRQIYTSQIEGWVKEHYEMDK